MIGKFALLDKMQQLADIDAKQLQHSIEQAIDRYHPKQIVIVTHVPPFKETCLYQGKISNDDWLPYFGSKAMGDVLMAMAQQYASVECLVLCGHTHSDAHYQPLDNLTVRAGHAEYYELEVQSDSDGYNL